MILQTIDTAEPNFPVNIFTPKVDTTETSETDWLAITCCGYTSYPHLIDSIWETDADE